MIHLTLQEGNPLEKSRFTNRSLILGCFAVLTFPGCTGHSASKMKVAMANPASVYCEEQGGKLEIRHEKEGDVGYCHLAYGRVVEEWVLYRAAQRHATTAPSEH